MMLFFPRRRRFATAFSTALALLLAAPTHVRAQEAHPFTPALAAMEAKDWTRAIITAAPLGKPATDLVIWSRLKGGEGSFDEVAAFLQTRPDWPERDKLRLAAERKIAPYHSPQTVADFFAQSPPQTGEGAVAYARALLSLGRPTEVPLALLLPWLSQPLDQAGEEAMLEAFGGVLQPYIWARMDAMLWRWRIGDAERLVHLLPDERRALFEARVAQIRGRADRGQKLAEVPRGLQGDAGLAYDRFNRLADGGDYSEAIEIAKERSFSETALGQPARWASWRAQLSRWLLREGRAEEAYHLASAHFLSSGEQFADLEWLSGYIALRALGRADVAAAHFERMAATSLAPISVARSGYWQGRAAEAQGLDGRAYFEAAAKQQTAFYGLLAAEHLGQSLDPALTGREYFGDWRRGSLLLNDRVLALRHLLGAGARGQAVLFLTSLAQSLPRAELGQLGAMLTEMNEPFLTLLLGKAAAARGIVLPAYYYPLHDLAAMDLPVEPALALSIARRESEFNHTVGSPAGALGLMQVMPATAEEIAKRLDLPFNKARLTSDWAYNATLGTQYLSELQERFGPSPALIAVGYNAGPGRVRQWIGARGDPRLGAVDLVDWIEAIPFTETRNYVMRVAESLPVYRARLTGQAGEIGFSALLRGSLPQVRPVARPDVSERSKAED